VNPESIIMLITAIAEAVREGFRFANTEAGQQLVKKSIENQAAFEKGVQEVGHWFVALLSGKLTK
jgi:hypothetical protein